MTHRPLSIRILQARLRCGIREGWITEKGLKEWSADSRLPPLRWLCAWESAHKKVGHRDMSAFRREVRACLERGDYKLPDWAR